MFYLASFAKLQDTLGTELTPTAATKKPNPDGDMEGLLVWLAR